MNKKQSLQLNSEDIRLQSLSKSKTEKVLQKWASDEGEIQEEDIRKAASNYAKLEINNRILKWIIVVVIVFLFVLLGFMIASVVIGVNITKDITVKNGALVSNSGDNSIIKTSNVKYNTKLTLHTPIEVIDSMRTISMNINEGLFTATVQFDVVSYVYIPGKQLTFYGHTHMANVLPDGSVKYELLVPFDGAKRDATTGSTGTSTGATATHTVSSNQVTVTNINSCDDLANIQEEGSYLITKNLVGCSFNGPLLAGKTFKGFLDGGFHNVTFNGAALFDTFGGALFRINLFGTVNDADKCGVVARTVLTGSFVSRVGVYSTLVCSSTSASVPKVAGLFFGAAQSNGADASLVLQASVSQGKIQFADSSAHLTGFVGLEQSSTSIITFEENTFDTTYESTSTSTAVLSFLNDYSVDNQNSNNFCLTEADTFTTTFTECKTSPRHVDLGTPNCDSICCYPRTTEGPRLVFPTPDLPPCSAA